MFNNCSRFKNVTLLSNITSIENLLFTIYTSLKTTNIPSKI